MSEYYDRDFYILRSIRRISESLHSSQSLIYRTRFGKDRLFIRTPDPAGQPDYTSVVFFDGTQKTCDGLTKKDVDMCIQNGVKIYKY